MVGRARWSWFGAAPHLRIAIDATPGTTTARRVLTVVYALLSVLIVYRVGREAFGVPAALIARSSLRCIRRCVHQHVRPDSACVFFACWRCGAACAVRPTTPGQSDLGGALSDWHQHEVHVGVSWACSCSSMDCSCAAAGGSARLKRWYSRASPVGAVALVFALTTPYFFLDYATAKRTSASSVANHASRRRGFSAIQNLLFYIRAAQLSLPQVLAALVALRGRRKRQGQPLLLLAFPAVLLLAITPHACTGRAG